MLKISIITLQNISNYGSVLQAYASQFFFQSLGYQVEIVDYWRKNMIDQNVAHDLIEQKDLKLKKYWCKNGLLKLIVEGFLYLKIKNYARPFRKFVREKLITTSMIYTSYESLKINPPVADVYCVGSDQVWNSDWNGGFDPAFYLGYVPKGKEKIAFASSFGIEHISQQEEKCVKKYLTDFNLISVREKSAVNLLQNMGISGVKCILDPTLLITKEQWEILLDKKVAKKEKYILVYQLNDSDFFDQAVEEAEKMTSLKVIRLEYKKTNKLGKHIVRPSVSEWITYFYNADYVITDSFHATAFSINFEKQFLDILPPQFGTRITNVLELFGLSDRKVVSLENITELLSLIDYTFITNTLNKYRLIVKNIFYSLHSRSL